MQVYDTEEQQVEAIKDWLRENGKAILIGVVIALCAVGGWRYHSHTTTQTQQASSLAYNSVMQEIATEPAKTEEALSAFIANNKESEYAVLAALYLAKDEVEQANYTKAQTQLQWVKANSADSAYQILATYRLAKVLLQEAKYDDALAELALITDKAWASRVLELKGDLLLLKNDRAGAKSAYTQALQEQGASQTLQIKLDDLAE